MTRLSRCRSRVCLCIPAFAVNNLVAVEGYPAPRVEFIFLLQTPDAKPYPARPVSFGLLKSFL